MIAHLSRHSLSYAVAVLLACSAGFIAVYDNFWPLEPDQMAKLGWWQVLAVVAKCLAAAATALVGYLMKSPLEKKPDDKFEKLP